ncbi:hypothetical protein VTN49DRAFT_5526 [Thermomyces lanuginosus]|uniref:uncharacterized protein n=1 Tax=Thermomyces lanuginosus TaxID=5541 RepID=UPI00374319AD
MSAFGRGPLTALTNTNHLEIFVGSHLLFSHDHHLSFATLIHQRFIDLALLGSLVSAARPRPSCHGNIGKLRFLDRTNVAYRRPHSSSHFKTDR